MPADHKVWLMAVENGRSVLQAANPGRPDMEVARASESMIRGWWCSSGGRSEAQRPITTSRRLEAAEGAFRGMSPDVETR